MGAHLGLNLKNEQKTKFRELRVKIFPFFLGGGAQERGGGETLPPGVVGGWGGGLHSFAIAITEKATNSEIYGYDRNFTVSLHFL